MSQLSRRDAPRLVLTLVAAIFGSLLGGVGPATAELVELGPERAIPSEVQGTPMRPAVAVAADGRAAVAWIDQTRQGGGTNHVTRVQLFGAEGEREGAPLELAVSFDPVGRAPAPVVVAAGSDGAFLLAWRDEGIRLRRVGPDGSLGKEQLVQGDESPPFYLGDPVLAAAARGGFVLVWHVNGPEGRIVLRHLDGMGKPSGPERLVATGGAGDFTDSPLLSVGPAGEAMVFWSDEGLSDRNRLPAIYGRWFAPDGSPVGERVGPIRADSIEDVALTHLSNGNGLVVWQLPGREEPPFALIFRRYDASGRFLAEESAPPPPPPADPDARLLLAPVLGGGVFLARRAHHPAEPNLVGQLLDASFTPVGEPIRISFFDYRGVCFPALASDGRSRVFAVWQVGQTYYVDNVYGRDLRVVAAGALAFTEPTARVGEGEGAARLTVRRVGFAEGVVSVTYRAVADTAEVGEDFRPEHGMLTWADGDLSERILELPILQDAELEAPEVVRLALFEPQGGAVLGTLREAQVVIEDDDGRPRPGRIPMPISPEQQACDRARLLGLLDRIELLVPGSSKTAGVNLSLTASGDFAGIAYTGNGPVTAEYHLAFSTDPEATTLLLNPERPQLPAVALVRNPVNSDLVASGDRDSLTLRLRPTLGVERPPDTALLVVDNLDGAAGRASQVKPGRGLAGLLAACHRDRFVARDVHVFRVLSKIVRLDVDGAERTEIAIHRASAIDAYRLHARAFDAEDRPLGTVVARLTVTYGADGSLRGGELAIVPPCPGSGDPCTTLERPSRLHLVRPTFAGELWTPTPYGVETPVARGEEAVSLDWTDLLAGTTWLHAR